VVNEVTVILVNELRLIKPSNSVEERIDTRGEIGEASKCGEHLCPRHSALEHCITNSGSRNSFDLSRVMRPRGNFDHLDSRNFALKSATSGPET
jgi:hypothetical protein